jgi:hypothetical protein
MARVMKIGKRCGLTNSPTTPRRSQRRGTDSNLTLQKWQ